MPNISLLEIQHNYDMDHSSQSQAGRGLNAAEEVIDDRRIIRLAPACGATADLRTIAASPTIRSCLADN
jgi:hypothetical protein